MNALDFCPNYPNLFGHSGDILGLHVLSGHVFKNQAASFFLLYDYLTSCKKSEKTHEPSMRSCTANERTNGRTTCWVNEWLDKKRKNRANFRKTIVQKFLTESLKMEIGVFMPFKTQYYWNVLQLSINQSLINIAIFCSC